MINKNALEYAMKEIESSTVSLTPWEMKFINRMKAKMFAGRELTEKEAKVVMDIHEKATEVSGL